MGLAEWSKNTMRDSCMGWVNHMGRRRRIVARHLSSLKDLRMPLYRPYSDEEKSIMWPATSWTIEGKRMNLYPRKGFDYRGARGWRVTLTLGKVVHTVAWTQAGEGDAWRLACKARQLKAGPLKGC